MQPSIFKPSWFISFFKVIFFIVIVLILAKWATGPTDWKYVITAENGPVERVSAALWFMGMVWCGASAMFSRTNKVDWLILTFFLLLLGLRELDAHIWSTRWNLDKLANYWNSRYPLYERVMVLLLFVVPTLYVAGIGCIRVGKRILPGWSKGEEWVGHLFIVGFLLVFCPLLDKIGAYTLPNLGFSPESVLVVMGLEELLECLLASYTIVVLWPYWEETLLGPS